MALLFLSDTELDYIQHLVERDEPITEMEMVRDDVLRTILEEKDGS